MYSALSGAVMPTMKVNHPLNDFCTTMGNAMASCVGEWEWWKLAFAVLRANVSDSDMIEKTNGVFPSRKAIFCFLAMRLSFFNQMCSTVGVGPSGKRLLSINLEDFMEVIDLELMVNIDLAFETQNWGTYIRDLAKTVVENVEADGVQKYTNTKVTIVGTTDETTSFRIDCQAVLQGVLGPLRYDVFMKEPLCVKCLGVCKDLQRHFWPQSLNTSCASVLATGRRSTGASSSSTRADPDPGTQTTEPGRTPPEAGEVEAATRAATPTEDIKEAGDAGKSKKRKAEIGGTVDELKKLVMEKGVKTIAKMRKEEETNKRFETAVPFWFIMYFLMGGLSSHKINKGILKPEVNDGIMSLGGGIVAFRKPSGGDLLRLVFGGRLTMFVKPGIFRFTKKDQELIKKVEYFVEKDASQGDMMCAGQFSAWDIPEVPDDVYAMILARRPDTRKLAQMGILILEYECIDMEFELSKIVAKQPLKKGGEMTTMEEKDLISVTVTQLKYPGDKGSWVVFPNDPVRLYKQRASEQHPRTLVTEMQYKEFNRAKKLAEKMNKKVNEPPDGPKKVGLRGAAAKTSQTAQAKKQKASSLLAHMMR